MDAEPTTEHSDGDRSPPERWYDWLQERPGDRAALRRAQQVEDAYSVAGFHLLLNWLGEQKPPPVAARIAMVLAHIRQDWTERANEDEPAEAAQAEQPKNRVGTELGRSMVLKGPSGKPRVSPERLRLLLSTDEPDQFLRLLRGILGQLDGKAPVSDVAKVMDAWHSPTWRTTVRRQIFLSYFSMLSDTEIKNA